MGLQVKISNQGKVVGVGDLGNPEATDFNVGAVQDEIKLAFGRPTGKGGKSLGIGGDQVGGGAK